MFVSLFGFLAVAGGSRYLYLLRRLFSGFFFLFFFFLIYCQHEWVNRKSRPFVLQPVLDSQRTENSRYVATVTELDGIALQNYQAGVGFVQLPQGKIELQAFSKRAIWYMSNAECRSRLMLGFFFIGPVSIQLLLHGVLHMTPDSFFRIHLTQVSCNKTLYASYTRYGLGKSRVAELKIIELPLSDSSKVATGEPTLMFIKLKCADSFVTDAALLA